MHFFAQNWSKTAYFWILYRWELTINKAGKLSIFNYISPHQQILYLFVSAPYYQGDLALGE
jgi:hypothetical protein